MDTNQLTRAIISMREDIQSEREEAMYMEALLGEFNVEATENSDEDNDSEDEGSEVEEDVEMDQTDEDESDDERAARPSLEEFESWNALTLRPDPSAPLLGANFNALHYHCLSHGAYISARTDYGGLTLNEENFSNRLTWETDRDQTEQPLLDQDDARYLERSGELVHAIQTWTLLAQDRFEDFDCSKDLLKRQPPMSITEMLPLPRYLQSIPMLQHLRFGFEVSTYIMAEFDDLDEDDRLDTPDLISKTLEWIHSCPRQGWKGCLKFLGFDKETYERFMQPGNSQWRENTEPKRYLMQWVGHAYAQLLTIQAASKARGDQRRRREPQEGHNNSNEEEDDRGSQSIAVHTQPKEKPFWNTIQPSAWVQVMEG